MSETYEAVQTIGGRWEIRGHHDDCAEGIPLNEAEIRRAVACLYACAGLPTDELERGRLAEALDALRRVSELSEDPVARADAGSALQRLGVTP